jgi:hypothetical protein
MDRDHQDLFLLSQRYASLLHRTEPDVQPSSSSSSSSSHQSYVEANARAQVDADIKADTAILRQKTASIVLSEPAAHACSELVKVAAALQVSRVSYANVVETLLDVEDVGRLSARVSQRMSSDNAKAAALAERVHGLVLELERVLQHQGDSLLPPSDTTVSATAAAAAAAAINDPATATATATSVKIQKYLEKAQALRDELAAAGVFALCPAETAKEFTSLGGVGPLPHAALKALADRIDADARKLRDMVRDLAGRYGYPAVPHQQHDVEREVERLREECAQLETQLNDAINNGADS